MPMFSRLVRAFLLLHVAGAVMYWAIQPRGFALGRALLEHQVIAPAVFAISFATLLEAQLPRVALFAVGAIAGFQAAISATFAVTGDSVFARAMIAVLAVAVGVVLLVLRRVRRSGVSARNLWGGGLAGALLGAAFVYCTWAPPPSTRPFHRPGDVVGSGPAPSVISKPGYRLRALGQHVLVEDLRTTSKANHVFVVPALDFPAASGIGTWTLFRSRAMSLPAWEVAGNSLRLRAASDDLAADCFAWVASDRVHIRCATSVKRDIAAHLSSAVRVQLPAEPITVDGMPWNTGHATAAPVEFLAFRKGRVEFLRSSAAESGPFTILHAWDPHDPVVESDGWKAQVLGWAAQSSLEESPTAGWGVSQGTIERVRSLIIWSLASTSIGRGYHTVRTGAGTYVLEVVLSR